MLPETGAALARARARLVCCISQLGNAVLAGHGGGGRRHRGLDRGCAVFLARPAVRSVANLGTARARRAGEVSCAERAGRTVLAILRVRTGRY